MTTSPEDAANDWTSGEAEEILAMRFGGKTIRENLDAAIASGRVVRLPDGKLSLPERASVTQFFGNGVRFESDCLFLNDFLFMVVYGKSSVPLGCAHCYKVKVEVRTMRDLMAAKKIADGFDCPAKSGGEVDRTDNQSLFSTYFFIIGLDRARAIYKRVREAIDEDPTLGPSVKVFIKRGCTNYEHACGPSDRYTFDPRLEKVEAFFRKRWRSPKASPALAKKYRDAAVLLQNARIAFRIGDDTYKDFTGGKEIYPETVTYDPDGP